MTGLIDFSRVLASLYCLVNPDETAALLDGVRTAVIVVDRDCSVVHVTDAAAAIVNAEDGLRIRGGVLEASHTSVGLGLRRCVDRAIADGRIGTTIACNRPSGRWPYIVHALPLGVGSASSATGHALLVVVNTDENRCPPTALIQHLFGMTRAEAGVAVRVVSGDGLRPISEEMNLALSTVKTHLQHVFDKTRTHRQAELVRLLLSVAP